MEKWWGWSMSKGTLAVMVGSDVVVVVGLTEKRLVARKAMLAEATCWTCAHTVRLLCDQ
jgi:hypothetical protein